MLCLVMGFAPQSFGIQIGAFAQQAKTAVVHGIVMEILNAGNAQDSVVNTNHPMATFHVGNCRNRAGNTLSFITTHGVFSLGNGVKGYCCRSYLFI